MIKKWWALALVASVSFVLGYGVVAHAFPSYNDNRGYFRGRVNATSDAVWPVWSGKTGCEGDGATYAIPGWVVADDNNDNVQDQAGVTDVDIANRFVAYVRCKLQNTANTYVGHQDRVGAAFIIASMTNTNYGNYLSYAPDDATFNRFRDAVVGAAQAGWVNWRASLPCDTGIGTWTAHNTYFQSAYQDDVASYYGCGSSSSRVIIFTNGSSDESQWYVIKRTCANPVGAMKPVKTPWVVSGRTIPTNLTNSSPSRLTNPYPGDVIKWTHYAQNLGPADTSDGNIWYNLRQDDGTVAEGGAIAPGTIGAYTGVYRVSQGEVTMSQAPQTTIQASDVGKTICQRIYLEYFDVNGVLSHKYGDWACVKPVSGVNFDISGVTRVNGGTTDITVGVGGSVQFTHQLSNSGASGMTATNVPITWWTQYASSKTPASWSNSSYSGSSGSVPSGLAAGGSSAANLGQYTENTITDVPPGQTRCRRIAWTPDKQNDSGTYYSTPVCVTVTDFNVQPEIIPVINGTDRTPNTDVFVEPGDTVSFRYEVWNSGQTSAPQINCRYGTSTVSNYNNTTPGLGSSAETPLTLLTTPNCAYSTSTTFPARVSATQPSVTPTAQQTTPTTAAANMSYCKGMQTVWSAGSSTVVRACALVVSKPVFQVNGGDIAVGGSVVTDPQATDSCSRNNGAAIIGWNRGASGGWLGAGAQYAAYAMNVIFGFATSRSVSAPTGLAFANTAITPAVDTSNNRFGGMFGSSPCIPDYFAAHPAAADLSGATIVQASLTAGDHYWSGGASVNLGDNTTAATTPIVISGRTTLYVNGDLYITHNVTYTSSGWTSATVPMLRVVVSGNIYIKNTVDRLDGMYIAQPTAPSTKGIIDTCATSAVSLTLDTLYANCGSTALTVNGTFTARQIQLRRASGTVGSGGAPNPAPAETFNFNPMLWIAQPTTSSSVDSYDAITSLPPVL